MRTFHECIKSQSSRWKKKCDYICHYLRNKVYKCFCSLPCFLFSFSRDGQRSNMKREKRMLQLEQTVQVSSCSKIKGLICHLNSSLGVDNNNININNNNSILNPSFGVCILLCTSNPYPVDNKKYTYLPPSQ